MFAYPPFSPVYTASIEVTCLQRMEPIMIAFKGSSTIHCATASFHALQQMFSFKDTLIAYSKIDSKGKNPINDKIVTF